MLLSVCRSLRREEAQIGPMGGFLAANWAQKGKKWIKVRD
jgi:hypothetical protein